MARVGPQRHMGENYIKNIKCMCCFGPEIFLKFGCLAS